MKKIILILLIFFIYLNPIYSSTNTATSYTLMDQDSGRVLLSKNKDKPMLIASISKIMTCILAIENANLNDIVTVTDIVDKSYGSGIYIKEGEQLTLLDLLYGLMLRSGNDAAIMIATYISKDEETFVKLMNDKAKEIGMYNTIFYNSSGLDNEGQGNISTTYDMALLTKYAMNNKTYREIVKTKKYKLKTNLNTYIWYNKNKLLSTDYITGGKTGYTEKAKRTLVSTASKNNINLIIVTIKDTDDWNTHKSLYEYAFKNYESYQILNKKTFKVPTDTYYQNLYIKNNYQVLLKKEETTKLVSHIILDKKENYQDNDKVGTNYIYLNNNLIHTEDIYVTKKENKKNIFKSIKEIFS